MVDDHSGGLPLAVFLAALREQIKTAQQDTDPAVPIELGPVTVEVTMLTRKEAEGRAGVKFWVIDAGVSSTRANESTQKVTFELHPLGPGGTGRARINDTEHAHDPEHDQDTGHAQGAGSIRDIERG